MRIRYPVGMDKSIDAEIPVLLDTVGGKISSIGHIPLTTFGKSLQSLIHPIPYTSSLQKLIRLYNIPVILKVSDAVSHGMGIFTHDQRTVVAFIQRIVDELSDSMVHGSDNICMLPQSTLFKHHRPIIMGFQPFITLPEIVTVTCFISHGPHDHGRIVLMYLIVPFHPVYIGFFPYGLVHNMLLIVIAPLLCSSKGMGLNICLSNYIESIPVTKGIKVGIHRIMGGPDRIDIKLFHEGHIFLHGLPVNIMAGHRVMIVTVHPFHQYWFPVQ